jgi:hypothetical protein
MELIGVNEKVQVAAAPTVEGEVESEAVVIGAAVA